MDRCSDRWAWIFKVGRSFLIQAVKRFAFGLHAGTREVPRKRQLDIKATGSHADYSRLTTKYKFEKPNDRAALDLMNEAAKAVMKELPDLVIAYGNSDEYRYVDMQKSPF
jgi:tRNA(His) 5'-end guanylyltransferase